MERRVLLIAADARVDVRFDGEKEKEGLHVSLLNGDVQKVAAPFVDLERHK